jgi:hypothetical protein
MESPGSEQQEASHTEVMIDPDILGIEVSVTVQSLAKPVSPLEHNIEFPAPHLRSTLACLLPHSLKLAEAGSTNY